MNTIVKFLISDYQKLRKVEGYRSLKEQMLNDFEIIFNMRIDWQDLIYEWRKEPKSINYSMRILSSKINTSRGEIAVNFTTEIANYLLNSPIMELPSYYWQASDIAAQTIFKLAILCRTKQNKQHQDTIRIDTTIQDLIHAIPSIKEPKDDRHIKRYVINRLEKELEELKEKKICNWLYCDANKNPLSNNQLYWNKQDNKNYVRWNMYKQLHILFTPAIDTKNVIQIAL
ncbi:hypothetical protein AGMMS49592_5690 [Endomicrobiia bacterium]|nr:hypothetical protein AGMMS49592_5690 [Endomicrobiia bacterium]